MVDVTRVLELRKKGLTLQEIADELHLGRLDVFRILQRAGVVGTR